MPPRRRYLPPRGAFLLTPILSELYSCPAPSPGCLPTPAAPPWRFTRPSPAAIRSKTPSVDMSRWATVAARALHCSCLHCKIDARWPQALAYLAGHVAAIGHSNLVLCWQIQSEAAQQPTAYHTQALEMAASYLWHVTVAEHHVAAFATVSRCIAAAHSPLLCPLPCRERSSQQRGTQRRQATSACA